MLAGELAGPVGAAAGLGQGQGVDDLAAEPVGPVDVVAHSGQALAVIRALRADGQEAGTRTAAETVGAVDKIAPSPAL